MALSTGQITITDLNDGESLYTWIRYADSATGTGISTSPTNKTYIGVAYNKPTETASNTASDYTWSLIKGDKGDKGDTGSSGLSSYTHFAYATNATGSTGFSTTDPVGKTYLGVYTSTSATQSTNPASYKWTLIKGDIGERGQAGLDGRTPYLHTAYSTSSTGSTGFSLTDPTGKTFIGTYTDYTATDSTDPAMYKWVLIKGDKGDKGDVGNAGADGKDAVTGILSNETHVFPADSNGVISTVAGADTTMSIFLGGVDNSASWTVTATASAGVAGSLSGKKYTVSGMSVDTGYVDLVATRSGYGSVTRRFSLSKAKQGDTGSTGAKGDTGSAGQNATAYWLVSSVPALAKSLAGIYTPTTVTFTGKSQTGTSAPVNYSGRFLIHETTDGSTWVEKYRSSANESARTHTPTAGIKAVRVQYYLANAFTNLLDEQVITVVSDGATGSKGDKGDAGSDGVDGQTLYTWIKYADTPTTGMSDVPTNKKYMGIATNKTTPTKSTNYADYTWSLTQGIQGVAGTNGTNGTTTYTWVKYADDATGTGISDSSTGKRFLGLATNKTTPTESTNPADYTWSPLYDQTNLVGRNLLYKTNRVITNSVYNIAQYSLVEPIANGEIVTITLKGQLGTDRTHFGLYNSGGSVSMSTLTPSDRDATTGVYKKTFAWSVGTSTNSFLSIYQMASAGTSSSTIEWVKIERGAEATYYIIADEEVADTFSSVDNWKHSDGVTINGAKIRAGSIKVEQVETDFFKGRLIEGSTFKLVDNGEIRTTNTGVETLRIEKGQVKQMIADPYVGGFFGFYDGNAYDFRGLGAISGGFISAVGGSINATTGGMSSTNRGLVGFECSTLRADVVESEGRKSPSLQNGWTQYAGGFTYASYYKDADQIVHLTGLIKPGTTTQGTVLFTLPVKYRPSGTELFYVHAATAGGVRVDVNNIGEVRLNSSGVGSFLSLAGISFKAEG